MNTLFVRKVLRKSRVACGGRGGRGREITESSTIKQKLDKILSDLKMARSPEEIRRAVLNAKQYQDIKEIKDAMNNAKMLSLIINDLYSLNPRQANTSYRSTENLVSKLLQFLYR
jgi:hypothetical protein